VLAHVGQFASGATKPANRGQPAKEQSDVIRAIKSGEGAVKLKIIKTKNYEAYPHEQSISHCDSTACTPELLTT